MVQGFARCLVGGGGLMMRATTRNAEVRPQMSEHTVVAEPVDGATERRLVIGNLDDATLGEDTTVELCTVRCTGCAHRVRYSGDTVELTYPLIAATHSPPDTISLNRSVPWEMADVAADLSGPAATGPWDVMAAAHTWLARLRASRVAWPVQESTRMFV
jgi:hypothetical protein